MFSMECAVECPVLNPNWLCVRMLYFLRYLFSLLQVSFSIIFDKVGTIEIGRHCAGSVESSPLER